MQPVADNEIGLTGFATVTDPRRDETLEAQLAAQRVEYTKINLPFLIGMGGDASLICYTSPKSGQPVTVLCVPLRPDIDSFAEDYYYFVGLGQDDALALSPDDWIARYDTAKEIETR